MSRMSWWRRVVLAVAAVLAVVLVVGMITVFTVIRRPLPDHEGSYRLDGLGAGVEVVRDARGIPQIYADTSADLFMAQGYVHAQDRFFEMDYRRHVTAGRLSELVGADPQALAADQVIRTLGWREVAQAEWELLSADTRRNLQAYADGVNAYISSRAPGQLALEYTVLDVRVEVDDVERWDVIDSLAWLKAMAWDLLENYDDELERAVTYDALRTYGDDVALEMTDAVFPGYPSTRNLPILVTPELLEAQQRVEATGESTGTPGSTLSAPIDGDGTAGGVGAAGATATTEALTAAAAALDSVPRLLGEGEGIGSNSWVIGGEHTASGQPLLANDPHLGISQPGIWYQNGLNCRTVGPECPYEVAGFSFSGLPGVVIGHNAELAWGFTNLGADVVDLALERVYPDGTYLRDGERLPLEERREVIEVAGADPVDLVVRSTPRGPIVSDVLGQAADAADSPVSGDAPPTGLSGYAVAMEWTALTPGRTAEAIFALNVASDATDVADAARLFEVPSQNIVFATTDGDIGYQAPGRIPVRPEVEGAPVPNDGSWPRPGWDSRYDWTGFVPPEEMPSVLNPPEGFVVAANQLVTAPGDGPFLGADFDHGYRSEAIRTELEAQIEAGEPFTPKDMNRIQLNDANPYAEMLVPVLTGLEIEDQFTRDAVELLEDWDMRNDPGSAGAAYFAAVWTNVLRLTFWDELPSDHRPDGGSRWLESVRDLIADGESPWWDDRATLTVVEQRDEVLAQALTEARVQLTVLLGRSPQDWRWGDLHQAAPQHPVLGGEAIPGPVRTIVNRGPTPVGGGSSIVNATGWDASVWDGDFPDFSVATVPSMRMVVDLSDLDASTWVQLTGSSGHPLSPHYDDQFAAWAAGETFAWPFSREAVQEAGTEVLTLSPPG